MDLIRIHPDDNVGVAPCSLRKGQHIRIRGREFPVLASVGLGHKFALVDIPSGRKVLKYGVPIGSASRDIRIGEHVHLHNLKSDYLPTYTHEEGARFSQ